jgi:hypothetical protein
MNAKQLKVVQRITNNLESLIPGAEFSCHEVCGLMMVSATNCGNVRWYEKSEFVLLFVGKHGGLNIKKASSHVRKMMSYMHRK